MYGTVARMQVQEGRVDEFVASMQDDTTDIPGYLSSTIFRLDNDPNALILSVVFESKDAYLANANDPAQHERYLKMRSFLTADPEWNDGEILHNGA